MLKFNSFFFFVLSVMLFSCKKNSDLPLPDSPMLGTRWTYQLKNFSPTGTLLTTSVIRYTATSEVTFGGDTWLKITDSLNNIFFILKKKSDGLYQYDNNSPNLLCKDPAVVNDQYTSYNAGDDENFTVTSVNESLAVPKGTVIVNRYDGEKGGNITDIFWYNKDLWITKIETYVPNGFTGVFHRDKRWELMQIEY